ncbi:MAG TPA: TrbC/VirB2 family protein [Pseudobdellovibrionaceae bacterium]|jgi:type IV secretory pathway VirB2 component (pilin)
MKNFVITKVKNIQERTGTLANKFLLPLAVVLTTAPFAQASVESSLSAVQDKLVGTILPLAAIVGLSWAGLSFVIGHPQARQRMVYALIGAGVGFGAESLISLVRSLIH